MYPHEILATITACLIVYTFAAECLKRTGGNNMSLYNIVIEYYRTIKDIEAGKPCKVVESGFKPMTLKEAEICKSKMSNHPASGYNRINKIIQVGEQ